MLVTPEILRILMLTTGKHAHVLHCQRGTYTCFKTHSGTADGHAHQRRGRVYRTAECTPLI
jgi:hypothetical protein